MKPLRGGIRLEGKKEATLTPWTIVRHAPPSWVRIPYARTPLVKAGDYVRVGERIAEAVHASVSGEVTGVGETIEIVSDGKDEPFLPSGPGKLPWESLPPEEIFHILSDSGVPLTPHGSFLDTVIVNACESEPYLTSDHALLMSHPLEILKGAEILRRAWGAREWVIALEDNKEEVAELLRSKIFFLRWPHARVEVLPNRYPQGADPALVRSLLGRFLPPGRVLADIGVAMPGVAETYAAYEAVVLQKPFYERAVTLGGECMAQPRNAWLRVGTLVEDAVKIARGFLRKPGKVILGGPMTGVEIENLKTPVLKETRGILALAREVLHSGPLEPCVRCGLCVESCPVEISPALISLAAEEGRFDLTEEYGAAYCIGCGNCAYVCPAKRPMVQLIHETDHTTRPYLRSNDSVPKRMWTTVLALFPACVAAISSFGFPALRVLAVSTASAVLTELGVRRVFKRPVSVDNGSVVIMGILLGLVLPHDFPSWAVSSGAFFAVFFGKEIFGGLGRNPFNPTLVALALLYLGPLGQGFPSSSLLMEGEGTSVAILAGGAILIWAKLIHWEVPILYGGAFLALQTLFREPTFLTTVQGWGGNGLLLAAAFFLVTDPVTTPVSRTGGRWFGLGAGVLTFVFLGQMPLAAALTCAVLATNALTPRLDRFLASRPKADPALRPARAGLRSG